MTLLTVAIPVYNREQIVRGALESALAQNLEGLEILVIDNRSTDRTWEVVQSYSDPRLRRVRNDANVGLFGNLNRCLELTTGRYLRILCSDDRLTPDCLAREVALMEAHPSASLLSTRAREIDASERPLTLASDDLPPGLYPGEEMIGHVLWIQSHYFRNPLNFPSGILMRTEATRRIGGFRPELRQVGDLDYWFRMLLQGDALIADHVGCFTMIHDKQETQTLREDGTQLREIFQLAREQETLLQRQGIDRQVVRRLIGCTLFLAFRFDRLGKPDAARLYREIAREQGARPFDFWSEMVPCIFRIQLNRRLHIRFHPRLSYRPLGAGV